MWNKLCAIWPCGLFYISTTSLFLYIPLSWWSLPLFFLSMLAGFDCAARLKDYDKARELYLAMWKSDPIAVTEIYYLNINTLVWLLNRYRRSRCQRNACLYAIKSISLLDHDRAVDYYHILGYRWYHFLPDHTFSRRSPFLSKRFYLNLIGV